MAENQGELFNMHSHPSMIPPLKSQSLPSGAVPWNLLESRDRRVIRDLSLASLNGGAAVDVDHFSSASGTIIFWSDITSHATRSSWWLKLKRVTLISNFYIWNRLDLVTRGFLGRVILGWNGNNTASQKIITILFARNFKKEFSPFGAYSPPIKVKTTIMARPVNELALHIFHKPFVWGSHC